MHWEMWARFDLCTITCMKITWLASLPAEIYKSCRWEDIIQLLLLSQTSVIHLFYYSTILLLKRSSLFHFSTSYSTFFPFYCSSQIYLQYLCTPSVLYILPLHSTVHLSTISTKLYVTLRHQIPLPCPLHGGCCEDLAYLVRERRRCPSTIYIYSQNRNIWGETRWKCKRVMEREVIKTEQVRLNNEVDYCNSRINTSLY